MAAPSPKDRAARVLPERAVERLDRLAFWGRRARVRAIRGVAGALGFNIVQKGDYYSTLPDLSEIEGTRERWNRPSELVGVEVDLVAMREHLDGLADRWDDEYVATAGSCATAMSSSSTPRTR